MRHDQDNERLLVLRAQAGDTKAFEQLLICVHPSLRSHVCGMVGPATADDVLQEVALRIFRQIRFLLEPRAFRAWAQRITTRAALAHLQREKRWREFETDPEIIDALPARLLCLRSTSHHPTHGYNGSACYRPDARGLYREDSGIEYQEYETYSPSAIRTVATAAVIRRFLC